MLRILLFLLIGIVLAQNKINMPYDFSRHQGYIIKDGNAYYVGMVGVKGGNTYLKFTHKSAAGIWLKGLKKLSNEKALEKVPSGSATNLTQIYEIDENTRERVLKETKPSIISKSTA